MIHYTFSCGRLLSTGIFFSPWTKNFESHDSILRLLLSNQDNKQDQQQHALVSIIMWHGHGISCQDSLLVHLLDHGGCQHAMIILRVTQTRKRIRNSHSPDKIAWCHTSDWRWSIFDSASRYLLVGPGDKADILAFTDGFPKRRQISSMSGETTGTLQWYQ